MKIVLNRIKYSIKKLLFIYSCNCNTRRQSSVTSIEVSSRYGSYFTSFVDLPNHNAFIIVVNKHDINIIHTICTICMRYYINIHLNIYIVVDSFINFVGLYT